MRTSTPTSSPTTGPSSSTPSTPAGRGWVDGEPDWSAPGGGGVDGAGRPLSASASTAGGAAESAADAGSSKRAIAPGKPAPGPVPPGPQPAPAGLRAGSVDDNADFAGYLDYLQRYQSLGASLRPFDPTGRVMISVHGANGLPVMGLPVTITAGGAPLAELRTSAVGRVVFLPATFGTPAPSYHVAAGGAEADVAPGGALDLRIATDGGARSGMPVDVLFLLDVTGSMGDEIAQLKSTIATVSTRLAQLPQRPDIRFAMTLYRDEGDAFVTSTFDFTGNVAEFRAALDKVIADGGGDTPEAVDEAFAAGLSEPSWRDPATAVQLVFLVGDAAPHVERQLNQAYPESIKVAQQRGITVHVIAASQTDDPAEHAFREIAQGTGGRFVFLAYGAGGAALGEHTDIAATDYEQLSLDDLVVRLVGEELAALTGDTFVAPTTSTTVTPPTNPPGQ